MAVEKLFKCVLDRNYQTSTLGDRYFLSIIILFSLLVSGCSENRLSQCEQIFRIANQVNHSSQDVSYTDDSHHIKGWLEAAGTMNRAASNLEALHINDSELIKSQHQLANIYRIYAQATYNAVKARENKNLDALKLARAEAEKAGEMQQELIKEVNNHCLDKT